MTPTRWASILLLRDLVTAAALLWLTLSDSWAAIAVSATLVVSRLVLGRHRPVGWVRSSP